MRMHPTLLPYIPSHELSLSIGLTVNVYLYTYPVVSVHIFRHIKVIRLTYIKRNYQRAPRFVLAVERINIVYFFI